MRKAFWPDEQTDTKPRLTSADEDRLDYYQEVVEQAFAGDITLEQYRRKTKGEWLFKLMRWRPECREKLLAMCDRVLEDEGKVETPSGQWFERDLATGQVGHEGRPMIQRLDGTCAFLWDGHSLSEAHWDWACARNYDSRYRTVVGQKLEYKPEEQREKKREPVKSPF